MIAPKRFSYSLLVAGALLFTLATPPKAALGFTPPSHVAPSTTHIDGHRSFAHSASASAADQVDAANGAAGSASPEKKKKRIAILLCPAQFCVPVDYTKLLDDIRSERTDGVDVVATRVAPLPRTEWIKVARQLPTKDFLDANLSVRVTLDWYFEAIEQGLAELFAEGGDDVDVCLIGHSIGGWVARAYLGGLSG